MLERMIAPLIDNLLAEYGLTRADIIRLVSQGDDLANRARVAINTIAEHVASIEKRQGEIAEGLAILLADLNERKAAEVAARDVEVAKQKALDELHAAMAVAKADDYSDVLKERLKERQMNGTYFCGVCEGTCNDPAHVDLALRSTITEQAS